MVELGFARKIIAAQTVGSEGLLPICSRGKKPAAKPIIFPLIASHSPRL